MAQPLPEAVFPSPDWPTCDLDDDGSGPCQGARVEGFARCWAHLHPEQLDVALSRLEPWTDLHAQGTTISTALLERILGAVRRRIGVARFDDAVFEGDADFYRSTFRTAVFARAAFRGIARFGGAVFHENVNFKEATFHDHAAFTGSTIRGVAMFDGAVFAIAERLGPLDADRLVLSRATFARRVEVEAATLDLMCTRTRFEAEATLRLRYACVEMGSAVFGAPSSISAAHQPFRLSSGSLEGRMREHSRHPPTGSLPPRPVPETPLMISLRGVDAAGLVLTDMDLARCRFAGAHNLDKLRLEGACTFGTPPSRPQFTLGWPPMRRWARRQVLAEECDWRAETSKNVGWPRIPPLEIDGPYAPDQLLKLDPKMDALDPKVIAALYRDLRKAQEDSKNQPGSADSYYGEMEMRRNDRSTALSERLILHLYWLLSGYGLRAIRALLFLMLLIGLAALSFYWWGFGPQPELRACVLYAAQSTVSLESKLNMPGLTFTGEAVRTAVRVLGPVLLGLALLAIRNRVKR